MTLAEAEAIVDAVDMSLFPTPVYVVAMDTERSDHLTIRAWLKTKNVLTGKELETYSVKVLGDELVARMTRDILLAVVYRMIRDLLVHELDECISIGGVRWMDPHAGEPERLISGPVGVTIADHGNREDGEG